MSFGDLKTRAGQQALNNFLESRSYIEGYLPFIYFCWILLYLILILNLSFTPSQADNSVFESLGTAPPGDLFHAVRFFNHINSFSAGERKAWPAAKGTSAPAPAAAKPAANDDDDVDLFGSDEEDAEAARIREERVAMYAAKKSNSTWCLFFLTKKNSLKY